MLRASKSIKDEHVAIRLFSYVDPLGDGKLRGGFKVLDSLFVITRTWQSSHQPHVSLKKNSFCFTGHYSLNYTNKVYIIPAIDQGSVKYNDISGGYLILGQNDYLKILNLALMNKSLIFESASDAIKTFGLYDRYSNDFEEYVLNNDNAIVLGATSIMNGDEDNLKKGVIALLNVIKVGSDEDSVKKNLTFSLLEHLKNIIGSRGSNNSNVDNLVRWIMLFIHYGEKEKELVEEVDVSDDVVQLPVPIVSFSEEKASEDKASNIATEVVYTLLERIHNAINSLNSNSPVSDNSADDLLKNFIDSVYNVIYDVVKNNLDK